MTHIYMPLTVYHTWTPPLSGINLNPSKTPWIKERATKCHHFMQLSSFSSSYLCFTEKPNQEGMVFSEMRAPMPCISIFCESVGLGLAVWIILVFHGSSLELYCYFQDQVSLFAFKIDGRAVGRVWHSKVGSSGISSDRDARNSMVGTPPG
ncbi:hypothetical protein K449DRAFT_433604 [Hypoxylon sp. EC38]|nr:hypothetical protein K449DRAFT_433604 [Hypoxylon sp. EC38]